MPSHSVKQAKVMSALAHGWHPSKGSVAKIPVKVAKEFHAADAGHKYGKGMHHKAGNKALHITRKYVKKAEGGEVEDTPEAPPKRLIMNMSPERPEGSPELTAALTKQSPLEGAEPPAPSLTARHESPRDVISNFLKGPDTKSYEPRAVLADKTMGLLDWTPPMMAEQAGEDVAKGDLQSAAMFAMPGAKKAKSSGEFAYSLLHAAYNPLSEYSASNPVGKKLKEQYGKDIATAAIDHGLTPKQIDSVKTYMTPGAQANFDKHYSKMAPKVQPAPWLEPDVQATKPQLAYDNPNYIANYHANQGMDIDKELAAIEAELGKVNQPKSEPKPKGKDTDIEDYYAEMEKHEAKEWEPQGEYGDEDYHQGIDQTFPNAPYKQYKQAKINQTEYTQALRNHLKPSDWMAHRPIDVTAEESSEIQQKIKWGQNSPEYLRSIGANPDAILHKGGFWSELMGGKPFEPGGYPDFVMNPLSEKNSEQAFHMASKPGIAHTYHGSENIGGPYVAWNPTGAVKFAEFDHPSFFGSSHYTDGDLDKIAREAHKMGFDIVAVHNMHDVGSNQHGLHTQYLVINTNVLRAPHAGFDPDKWHLRHPLAGIAGLAGGAGIYTYGDKAEAAEHKAEGGRVKAEKALPENHQLGMQVPKGGSMCANCKFLASPTTCGNKGFIEWNGGAKLPHPADEYCCDLYGHDKPEEKKEGGKVSKKEKDPEDHEFIHFAKGGLIDSDIPGRTDKIPMNVRAGSYVLPADIPSALGQNNTKAGSEVLKKMFSSAPYGLAPMKQKSMGHRFDKMTTPKVSTPGLAEGGKVDNDHVPIVAAGGEYVIHPDVVKAVGHGDMAAGHKVLDKFVLHVRKEHIKTLRKLKPPKG